MIPCLERKARCCPKTSFSISLLFPPAIPAGWASYSLAPPSSLPCVLRECGKVEGSRGWFDGPCRQGTIDYLRLELRVIGMAPAGSGLKEKGKDFCILRSDGSMNHGVAATWQT